MNTIYSLIRSKTETWLKLENENNQSLIRNTLEHIAETGKLRPPQSEAIETYLWIKFAGDNKRLPEMVKEGLLYDDVVAQRIGNPTAFTAISLHPAGLSSRNESPV